MRTRRLALTAAAVAAIAATATACGPDNSDAAAPTAPVTKAAAPSEPAAPATAAPAGAAPTKTAPPKSPAAPAGSASAAPGDKSGYGQVCGANDLDFGAKAETQAGGYLLISAKAKSGITCTLPAGHPVIAFGSGGIEAAAFEHGAGEQITLSGAKTVYAGIMTKTTKGNQAVQYTDVIIGIGTPDPNPVTVPVGTTPVDKPVVTNWHTLPKDAVPVG
ncbi:MULTISPECIES: DUF4232 domain-containing protein [Streptomycetaceae]|uniref:DUF4232 domain-containing protein n=1 Tax=Streptomycetaceae TaxID=2062 RepID=UPI0009396981|nr:DUF4232 domain-containing protein [Streptomyces sp. CB02056]OKI00460.1 hypothetical protein AMK13_32675 [Streptomyces sp. CB02056]